MHKACQIIRDTFSELIFDELTHTYIINGEILPSVSTLVSDFYEPFEIDKMSELCAQNSNKTAEEIRKEWENKGYNARMKGKRIHSFAPEISEFSKTRDR
ncbi:MAG: hypothetical protein KatS3mg002_1390 [Candidatus Woesearchaeota archaeon]|nr:MAG: hypothetical protein KatS3mg002_1390 [Candidatus Woesearchaeota archaeon]